MITDEQLAELERLEKCAWGTNADAYSESALELLKSVAPLIEDYKALKAENEELHKTCSGWGKANLELIEQANDFVNELLKNTPESFDDDVAAEAIAIEYLRHLEAEIESLRAYKAAWEEAYDTIAPSRTYGLGEEAETDVLDEIASKHGIVEAQQ